jgi:hypothetical protein
MNLLEHYEIFYFNLSNNIIIQHQNVELAIVYYYSTKYVTTSVPGEDLYFCLGGWCDHSKSLQ